MSAPSPSPSELSYIHPAVVSAGMLLALWALRHGLAMRALRVYRRRPPQGALRRHLVFAQPAAVLLVVGFGLGPASAALVRDWQIFRTVHGWIGLAALVCFGAGSLLGWQLKKGRGRRAALHGGLGVAGVLLGAAAALTGLELLP